MKLVEISILGVRLSAIGLPLDPILRNRGVFPLNSPEDLRSWWRKLQVAMGDVHASGFVWVP